MSDTPETDETQFGTGRVSVEFARRLERERDEAVRSCHIWQKGHSKLVTDRDDWKAAAVTFEKERDEALFDLAFRRDLFKIQENQLDELRKQLAVARKQNNERLTILQEHGLAEYGN